MLGARHRPRRRGRWRRRAPRSVDARPPAHPGKRRSLERAVADSRRCEDRGRLGGIDFGRSRRGISDGCDEPETRPQAHELGEHARRVGRRAGLSANRTRLWCTTTSRCRATCSVVRRPVAERTTGCPPRRAEQHGQRSSTPREPTSTSSRSRGRTSRRTYAESLSSRRGSYPIIDVRRRATDRHEPRPFRRRRAATAQFDNAMVNAARVRVSSARAGTTCEQSLRVSAEATRRRRANGRRAGIDARHPTPRSSATSLFEQQHVIGRRRPSTPRL